MKKNKELPQTSVVLRWTMASACVGFCGPRRSVSSLMESICPRSRTSPNEKLVPVSPERGNSHPRVRQPSSENIEITRSDAVTKREVGHKW